MTCWSLAAFCIWLARLPKETQAAREDYDRCFLRQEVQKDHEDHYRGAVAQAYAGD